MNLKTFQKTIEPSIIDKGKAYYLENRVVDLEEFDDIYWCSSVMGKEEYIVEVMVENFKIREASCDCKDNFTCKHVVAVLFAICEKKGLLKNNPSTTSITKSRKLTLKKFLVKISDKELRDFIEHYGKVNKTFKSDFEIYFADKDENFDVEKLVSSQIRTVIKKYIKWNYLNYSSSKALAQELHKITTLLQQYLTKGNLLDAVKFCKAFIEETIPIQSYSDDSYGVLNEVISGVVDSFIEITQQSPVPLKENIADYLKSELQNSIYFENSDVGYSLMELFYLLSSELNRGNDFIELAKFMVKCSEHDKNSFKYEYFLSTLVNFLKQHEYHVDAVELIQKNLHLPKIRSILVIQYIDDKNFNAAKQLINEGISLAQKGHLLGLEKQWNKYLLTIAEIEGDVVAVRKFLEEFAFSFSFDKHYYQKWKLTFSQEEWQRVIRKKISVIYDKVLKEQESIKIYLRMPEYALLSSLGPIFVEEQMYDQLMDLISKQNNLDIVLQYHPILCKLYPNELVDLYLNLLIIEADIATDRNAYKKLLKYVNMIYLDIPSGRRKLVEQVLTWKDEFKRRPAMIDEIEKFIKNVS